MEKEIELTCGKKVIVRSPGLNGELILWDFVATCEPYIDEFKHRLAAHPSRDEIRVFFAVSAILRDHWADLSGLIVKAIRELTGADEKVIREEMNLADRLAILRAGWEVMGLGKLMESVGMRIGSR